MCEVEGASSSDLRVHQDGVGHTTCSVSAAFHLHVDTHTDVRCLLSFLFSSSSSSSCHGSPDRSRGSRSWGFQVVDERSGSGSTTDDGNEGEVDIPSMITYLTEMRLVVWVAHMWQARWLVGVAADDEDTYTSQDTHAPLNRF
jgi:hypothetical protein